MIYVLRNINKQIRILADVSYNKKESRFVTVPKNQILTIPTKRSDIYIVLINCHKNDKINKMNNEDIDTVYIGTTRIKEGDNRYQFDYEMKVKLDNKNVIANFLDEIDLNMSHDYDDNVYVIETEMDIFLQRVKEYIILFSASEKRKSARYMDREDDTNLDGLAQHNIDCIRQYNVRKVDKYRSEYQRDRERIVNCKAFRRMVDKAQIFTAKKGIYYRTRMTHTLEVNQIAKAIAIALRLNVDLTEAIALGHDVGHTPFGHQGERTLRGILTKDIESTFLLKNVGEECSEEIFGGFKHNIQSVRVLSNLEEKYLEHVGLDVSYQVLEGILKHTSIGQESMKVFIDDDVCNNLHIEQNYSITLEGQVVSIADEIAQRGHDIDDAILSGLISSDEIISSLSIDKYSDLKNILKAEQENYNKNYRLYIENDELIAARFVSAIVGYFIKDVIENSSVMIGEYKKNISNMKLNNLIKERLIIFSQKGEASCKYLEKLINKKVINNTEVASFDYNGDKIIKKLFFTYYNNPKLLHYGTLRRVFRDIALNKNKNVSSSAIDLTSANVSIAKKEINMIISGEIDLEELTEESEAKLIKRRILVRNIVDYIAGMTDGYAKAEYHKLL